jgi:hypothetical protein
MRIPKSQIKENQYTSGNELVEKGSFKPYKGYYYIVNGDKFFSGKTFDPKAIELIKNSPQTAKVKTFSGNTLKYFLNAPASIKNLMSKPSVVEGVNPNIPVSTSKNETINRYFIKQQNTTPILIREVTEETYNSTTDPIYIKAILKWNSQTGFNQNEIDALDKVYMIGIKAFLSV